MTYPMLIKHLQKLTLEFSPLARWNGADLKASGSDVLGGDTALRGWGITFDRQVYTRLTLTVGACYIVII